MPEGGSVKPLTSPEGSSAVCIKTETSSSTYGKLSHRYTCMTYTQSCIVNKTDNSTICSSKRLKTTKHLLIRDYLNTSLLNTFHTKEYYVTSETNEVEPSAQIWTSFQDLLSENEKREVQNSVLKTRTVGGGTRRVDSMFVSSTTYTGATILK